MQQYNNKYLFALEFCMGWTIWKGNNLNGPGFRQNYTQNVHIKQVLIQKIIFQKWQHTGPSQLKTGQARAGRKKRSHADLTFAPYYDVQISHLHPTMTCRSQYRPKKTTFIRSRLKISRIPWTREMYLDSNWRCSTWINSLELSIPTHQPNTHSHVMIYITANHRHMCITHNTNAKTHQLLTVLTKICREN